MSYPVRGQVLLDQILVLRTYANSADQVKMPQNEASDQSLHCLLTGLLMQIFTRMHKTTNGLLQMIGLDKSTCQKRVNKLKCLSVRQLHQ